MNAIQILKRELTKLGVATDIDPLDEANGDSLVSLHITFPSGVAVDFSPAQDVPGEDGVGIIEVSALEPK